MPAVGEPRQPVGTAFTIRDPLPWSDVAAIAREGEGSGYAAVFLPETGARDTLATLSGLAGDTEELLLGTGVIPMPARTARLAAMAATTVQERSGGRHILGVGTGPSAPGALERLRAYVEEIRSLVGGSAPGAALRLPLSAPVPIWIAALGPKAVRLAGEIADGVILNWCTPERVAEARDAIRAAAVGADRDPDSVRIAVYVRASFSERADGALLKAAAEYGSYPAYARQFEAMGVERSPQAIVEAVCLRGDPDRARDRLEAYRTAGADLPVVYPVLAPGEGREAALAVLRTFAS
jgi:alkanesulfonate monooxygenase SsuD/methylene tetrahydromethanopterin reductase-like flavin-dependent oxidoreductase (luciferase family)